LAWTEVDNGASDNVNSVFTVYDSQLTIKDNLDATKAFQFQASGITAGQTRVLTVPDASTTLVGTDATQTLTNKTLTAPIIATISNTGTLTLPTSTDTLVGKATTDVLTNKTLTSPTLTTPVIASFASATHNHTNAAGGGQLTIASLSDATEWTTPTFAAGDFTGNASMTWTVAAGDVTTYHYTKIGKRMTVNWVIKTSTVGGTPSTLLQILIPGGFTSAREEYGLMLYRDNGGSRTAGVAFVDASNTKIFCQKLDSTNWTAATDTTQVQGSITFETTN
jgi:hypothetical protein